MGLELIFIVLGLLIDRLSKIWALDKLSKIDEIVIIKDIFSFSYLENRGAAFGIFQNKVLLLAIVTLSVIGALIFYVIKFKPTSKLFKISLALVVSGALGNLYDRVIYKYVVDFILVHYKEHYFPTFNVADMLVVVGTGLLALCILKEDI